MAYPVYSPSKKARLSTSSASSTTSVVGPVAGHTLSRRTSWNKNSSRDPLTSTNPDVMSNPLEGVFRPEDNPRPFKYEFPSQASLGVQDSATEDDEAHLTSDARACKLETVSPMRRQTTLQRVSHNLRRISLRVVNLASAGIDDHHSRLPENLEEDLTTPVSMQPQSLLRGTTLGLLGPMNPIRLAMYKIFMYP